LYRVANQSVKPTYFSFLLPTRYNRAGAEVEAKVDLVAKTVAVTLSKEVNDADLKKSVEDADGDVGEIKE